MRDFVIFRVAIATVAIAGCSFHTSSAEITTPDGAISGDAAGDAGGDSDAVASHPRVLHQTADDTIGANASLACFDTSNREFATTWYRAFALSDYGIVTTMHVTSVAIGIQTSTAPPAITIAIGAYSGAIGDTTINLSAITPLASTQATPGAAGTLQQIPIAATITAGGNFVISVAAPSSNGSFVIGATTSIESHPGYVTMPTCGTSQPQTMTTAGATGDVILYVIGETP